MLAVCAAFTIASSADACLWCDDSAPIPMLSYLQEQARYRAERSSLLDDITPSSEPTVPEFLLYSPQTEQKEPTSRFYRDYLCKFYPQCFVIIEMLFPSMCPDALREALTSYVYFISSGNWRYFVNSPDQIKFSYTHVTMLYSQLATVIHLGLSRLLVDEKTGNASLYEGWTRVPLHSAVTTLWRNQGHTDYHDIYALLLDFDVRLTYINILHRDYQAAYQWLSSLQHDLKEVKGTKHEHIYTQVERLYSDLVKMLRQRLWGAQGGHKNINYATSTSLEDWAKHSQGLDDLTAFAHSFVSHYECSVSGKFTHEYHPFLLDRTSESLQELERRLTSESLPLVGRLMLMGYEEQGVPRYYTNYNDAYFSDESVCHTDAGWSAQQYNRFGLLTGFLGKHANDLSEYAVQKMGSPLPVTHIDSDQVEIYDGFKTMFQEHAFGDAYQPVMYSLPRFEMQLVQQSMPGLCRELMNFWQTLYNNELKVTGKQHIVGTQDILFSIAYMQYLQRPTVPVLHFYMGPDITYPIVISSAHSKEVTRHAQSFVKQFIPQLTPRDGKKTAYVFCSFVDGVGKTTMLANVKNWMAHEDRIEEYEPVDNSSSQLATVFDFSDDVVIADLPAQVSHFTYKPDGFTYADIHAETFTDEEYAAIEQYVLQHQVVLKQRHTQLLAQARTREYNLPVLEAENPELSFMANLWLLNRAETNQWISFPYNGKYFLFHEQDPTKIRVRVPLADASSSGLKNDRSEQMIFSDGVRFPLSFKTFTDDLILQLKEHGVEQVVMVDFLSMYSRASRENIRVNYIVQQLALLYKDFSIEKSFYQTFANNPQVLALFDKPGVLPQFHRSLSYESWVRVGLYDILRECALDSIEGLPLHTVTDMLKKRLAELPRSLQKDVTNMAEKKLRNEYDNLQRSCGVSREFVTLQQFRATDLVAFSRKLSSIFTKKVHNSELNGMWKSVRDAHHVKSATIYRDPASGNEYASLDTNILVRVLGRFSPQSRDREQFRTLLRQTRACWYATLSNLLYSKKMANGQLEVKHRVPVPPVFAMYDDTGQICMCQSVLYPCDQAYKTPDYSLFEVKHTPDSNQEEELKRWQIFGNSVLLTDWSTVDNAHAGVYGFGHEVRTIQKQRQEDDPWRTRPIVGILYTNFSRDKGDENVLVHEKLFESMEGQMDSIKRNLDEWKKEAEANGELPAESEFPKQQEKDAYGRLKEGTAVKKHYLRSEQLDGVRLFLRAVCSLDLIAKDLEADLASRRGNKADFAANIRIFEMFTLPWLYGMLPKEPLFSDYEAIEPIFKDGWGFFHS